MATSNRFGSLLFCKQCGDLLPLPGDDDEIVCDGCGLVEDATGKQVVQGHAGVPEHFLELRLTSLPAGPPYSFREPGHHDSFQSVRFPFQSEAEEDESGAAARCREEEGLCECSRSPDTATGAALAPKDELTFGATMHRSTKHARSVVTTR
jgi:hypothetical protein